MKPLHALLALAALTGCPAGPDTDPVVVPVLGGGSHDLASVLVETIADASDGLNRPRDLAFNPEVDGELWVVSQRDDSVVILDHALRDADPASEHIIDPYAMHFMDNVSSIAFGAPGTFATCQESLNTYNGMGPENEFMGPTLWSSDREIFGFSNPEAVKYLGYDLGSHLDMLHESPLCMGIAWERANVYWAFDGLDGAIVRYDFHEDHGVGYDDHSDGHMDRYVPGELRRVANTPGHLVYERSTALLYIADTGNRRIAVLDTQSGEPGDLLGVEEPGTHHGLIENADLWTLVDQEAGNLGEVSGLALHEGLLFASDASRGNLLAFDDAGELVDWLPLGDVTPNGLAFGDDGSLFVALRDQDEVIRIQAR